MPEAKEEKLGTTVTYLDPDQTGKPVSMGAPIPVTFFPGEDVALEKFLQPEDARRMARKLAGNPYFAVEGGPDHAKLREAKAKRDEEVAQRLAEVSERQQQEAQRQAAAPQPPPSWRGPEQPRLEQGSTRERANRRS